MALTRSVNIVRASDHTKRLSFDSPLAAKVFL